ncbi:MAG: 2-oxoacid:acceptor oxidoreductase subunit alpha [Candidatus Kerfeldbacteria bacterium]|nr:2-oxoacid:acceptor oxidoreductase subunit alpha [Candidatus Kerfeldbacteria bacterium]
MSKEEQQVAEKISELSTDQIDWRIGGEAGAGIQVTGSMFALACSRSGMFIASYSEYPSLIRGGYTMYHVRAGSEKIYAHDARVDILVALNKETIDENVSVLQRNGRIVYDVEQVTIKPSDFSENVVLVGVPLLKLALECGEAVMKNSVALGASFALLGCDAGALVEAVTEQFKKKGTDILNQNIDAVQKGFEYVKKNYPVERPCLLDSAKHFDPQLVISGNEAVGIGAIASGCQFYAGYPMTPSTSLLHFMAAHDQEFGIVVKHAEDEISVINMAIGASYTGARAMIGTSGGGFALMNEGVSLCAMLETPLVIMVSSRPGPATGLPTWTAQGDLQFVIHAGHGEFPKIVIAPGDPQEAFEATWRAHNLADQFQIPVIVLLDKYLSESNVSIQPFPFKEVVIDRGNVMTEEELEKHAPYLRYEMTDTGVVPRVFPGMKAGAHLANSDEHAADGLVSESSEDRILQDTRRLLKWNGLQKHLPLPKVYGSKNPEVTMVVWGSQKAPALQAQQELEKAGVPTNVIHVQYVHPFPGDVMHDLLQSARWLLLIENNLTGQFGQLIRAGAHIDIPEKLLKDDGRPVFPSEIIERVRAMIT